MKFHNVDMHGIEFETSAGLPGFITRGAIKDLGNLGPQHRHPDQEPVFLQRAAEIERFAHRLAADGLLVNGTAVIGPEHVCRPVLENYKQEIKLLEQQRALIAAAGTSESWFIPRHHGRAADDNDKIAALEQIDVAIAELKAIIKAN